MVNEQCSFEIILHSGNANCCFIEAADLIEEGRFAEAQESMNEGEKELAEAQRAHMDILVKLSSGETVDCDVLLVHAFDHVLEAMANKTMATRLMKIYQAIENR